MTQGQCLCAAHRFRIEGDLVLMHNCHCSYCRKSHGSAYGTVIGVDASRLHWHSKGEVIAYHASKGYERKFCARCGSPLPAAGENMPLFVPTGLLDDDFEQHAEFHMFVASKAPWFEIKDDLPAFDGFPPGIDVPESATRESVDPAGGVRGSCLCGDIRYVVDGPAIRARNCHCRRCRLARGAAHASNYVVRGKNFRWTAGEGRVREYSVPESRFFTNSFCNRCGSKVPRVDVERGIVILPMGGFDDAPPHGPQEHIFVGSKAVWHEIVDDLPQYPDRPPEQARRDADSRYAPPRSNPAEP